MPRMLRRLTGPALAAALVAPTFVVTGLVGAGPAQADPTTPVAPLPSSPAQGRAQEDAGATASRADRASAALAGARSLLGGHLAAAGATGREATLLLRDLSRLRAALPATERAEADAILARPTDGAGDPLGHGYTTVEETPACGAHVCIHYVTSTPDKVPAADDNHNGTPDFVELARTTMEHVHRTYVKAGYRAPKSDGTLGGDARTDVYLKDIGSGIYGYCTTDDPSTAHDVWSYCVLDNGFQHRQFPTNTPTENLKVTAAHEYFHAVQFGYDVDEDRWLMEATATWVEDELYDGVNDNRQYLRKGQLGNPYLPLDYFHAGGFEQYGNWIFFRYLSEKWPASVAGLPTIVRAIWRQADGNAGAPDKYSIQAVKAVLAGKQTSLAKEFGLFSARNRFARTFYDEGAQQHYPQGPFFQTLRLGQRGFTTRADSSLAHLVSGSQRIVPKNVTGSRQLTVLVWLGAGHHDTSVVVDRISAAGRHTFKTVPVDAQGKGSLAVPFANARTRAVVVTLVNSGTHYTCGRGTVYSCQGKPLDDGLPLGLKYKTSD